eukprot:521957-Amphidinium_carterae.1
MWHLGRRGSEVLYGARVSGRTVPEMLRALREAGVDSIPGTSAEVHDAHEHVVPVTRNAEQA